MPREHEPSRLGRLLLRLRARSEHRLEIEADLVELLRIRAAARGVRYARRRWVYDVLSLRRPAAYSTRGEPTASLLTGLWQDVRVGLRVLAANRRFTFVAVAMFGLGTGMTTAVFSVVNAVLVRSLPYADAERLVAVTSVFETAEAERPSPVIALTDMADWRQRSSLFTSMGAFAYTQLPVRVGDRSFSPITALMDAAFLPTLGNGLAMGTPFSEASAPDGDLTAIISHAFWIDAFGGDRDAIGRAIAVDGTPYVVRAILADDFQFPRSDVSYFTRPIELLIPASSFPNFPASSRQWWGIARLKPGVGLTTAETELRSIAEGLSRDAATGDVWSVRLRPLADETTQRAREPLLVVMGVSIVLLLIACSNLMNLFFSRGVTRLREMSIRRAIGSTTGRLLRLLLVESLLVGLAGGAFGVWLASTTIGALVRLSPVHLPVTGSIEIDGTVLAFTTAVCLVTAVAAGLLPALHLSASTHDAARSMGRRASASRGLVRVQQTLCVTQIALGMALLAAAGLLARSLWQLNAVDPGFETERVLGFNLSVPNNVGSDDRVRFYAAALDEVRTIPGVERAGLISFLPPEVRAGVFMGLAIDGVPPPGRSAPAWVVNTLITSADYFRTMRMPVLRGRDLTDADAASATPVIVVNEAFVRRYLPDGEPLGRRIGTGFDGMEPVREIVGVVSDSHDRGLAAAPVPTVYIPFTQFSLPYGSVALRLATAPDEVIPVIRDRLRRLNPAVPVTGFQTVGHRIRESLREPRFYTLLAGTCAFMALLFVTFGLYGLVSYSVEGRTSELGIRMAIGAERSAILRMVLFQGLRLTGLGVALGLGLTVALSGALRSLLFQVGPVDPMTLAAATATVLLVTAAASYAPARRASRVNPITVLRYE